MPFLLHNSVENLADIKAETLTSEVTHQDPVYPTYILKVGLVKLVLLADSGGSTTEACTHLNGQLA